MGHFKRQLTEEQETRRMLNIGASMFHRAHVHLSKEKPRAIVIIDNDVEFFEMDRFDLLDDGIETCEEGFFFATYDKVHPGYARDWLVREFLP